MRIAVSAKQPPGPQGSRTVTPLGVLGQGCHEAAQLERLPVAVVRQVLCSAAPQRAQHAHDERPVEDLPAVVEQALRGVCVSVCE
jgi:hypothetical protein